MSSEPAQFDKALYAAAAVAPKVTCATTVIQSRVASNQGKKIVNPCILTTYKHKPNTAPTSSEEGVRSRDVSRDRIRQYATESAKCTNVATSITCTSKVSGGDSAPRPITMAAAKRASLKSIAGSASVKTNHKTICTIVDRIPAAMPA